MAEPPFWKKKKFSRMSRQEWEALCDNCGRCCLYKLQDVDTDRVHYTNVACRHLDLNSGHCRVYANRAEEMPDCVIFDPKTMDAIPWLPPTCGYRLLSEGRNLPHWHPLVSKDPESVRRHGISVRNMAIPEQEADLEHLERYIISW